MGSRLLLTIFLALLLCGCEKRQTTPRLIYVQAPPPEASLTPERAASAASDSPETLTIEEPPPPPPPAPPTIIALPLASPPPPAPKPRTHARTESHNAEDTPAPAESDQPAAAAAPPQLQPRAEASSGDSIRLQSRQKSIHDEITGLDRRSDLSAAESRTLQDAGAFLLQSEQALAHNDLPRAAQLAEKASQLLAALKQHR